MHFDVLDYHYTMKRHYSDIINRCKDYTQPGYQIAVDHFVYHDIELQKQLDKKVQQLVNITNNRNDSNIAITCSKSLWN